MTAQATGPVRSATKANIELIRADKHTLAFRPSASAFTFVDCIPPPRRD